ncbi:DUF2069 domain-containing protein [Reinekea sp. G2M2-21]|uniref:DUF2069 domain-containing protein n=1 Tax=Reinekea sp. G2M2-21 TaxID=2788942 RepID=UPI0018AA322D|nr:DUF2069 domain-containing protein [Reinekea sp. G2M2-21]
MYEQQINVNRKLRLHFFLLLAACVAGTFLSGPNFGSMAFSKWLVSGLVFSFIAMFPLLFFIPTVINPTPRSISWLGFFLLAYLVWSIIRIFSSNGVLGGLLITFFNVSTFIYAVIWLRPFKKQAKARAKQHNN